jgi:hypothetical protein
MTWKEAAAQVGTGTLITGLRALEGQMKKKDYKRLVATTAAQLLALHPDVGPRKALRWAERATGTRPSKRRVKAVVQQGLKDTAGAVATAAVAAGAAKVVGKLAKRAKGDAGDEPGGGEQAEAPS